ncbi:MULTISPECIES: hypothetical protein [Sphingobacterium]|jgi:hypothetical protein|uniref:Uncharacterized protein n=2 Tax=Sphingobacterium TaxID=28453 RepID=A0ACD5C4U6_9SPHI|nr:MULTISPECIES: hypothetical protein [Sphingobacterium]HAE68778.1 hypothetical protein [Sphingobacterium sp.]OFV21630.1 hypothetical protein HMPREF3127_00645 [Sphingobacterium sp. HMSC13C05]QQT45597.1 hypothetical protein I6J00_02625 [Sphingobacterium multivorum]QQT61757.1 hypothetical protein I6I97_21665 [Sphingobacterium multivorum]SUJ27597.1 Uncharacterised protein [Sphingobacterium multivorum]
MNPIKAVLIPIFVLLCVCCSSGDGSKSERLRADSLVNEVVNGRLALATLAESNEFMYFNDKYFHEPADLKVIPKFDKVQIQVVTYRIYQHVKLKNNRYVFNVQKASELHIPNSAFVYYQRSFDDMNRKAALSKDSIRLELPDNYASLLINE